MSILIEGMSMPPDGRYTVCVTHDSDYAVHWVFQNQDTLEFLKHGAVTEINEPHGRLIDADALLKEAEVPARLFPLGWKARFEVNTHAVAIGDVMIAPTVIPASEEGET